MEDFRDAKSADFLDEVGNVFLPCQHPLCGINSNNKIVIEWEKNALRRFLHNHGNGRDWKRHELITN